MLLHRIIYDLSGITNANEARFLGLILDNNLSWKPYRPGSKQDVFELLRYAKYKNFSITTYIKK